MCQGGIAVGVWVFGHRLGLPLHIASPHQTHEAQRAFASMASRRGDCVIFCVYYSGLAFFPLHEKEKVQIIRPLLSIMLKGAGSGGDHADSCRHRALP